MQTNLRKDKQELCSYQNYEKSCQETPNFPIKNKKIIKKPKLPIFSKIIKSIKAPLPIYLKKGTNTPKHHIWMLYKRMQEYKEQYEWQRNGLKVLLYQKAYSGVKKVVEQKAGNYTLEHLKRVFGGSKEENLQQFVINRINARVLNMIYEEHMEQYVFGREDNRKSKIQDKMTTMLFLYEYRSRLFNPQLCGGLQCQRPLRPKNNINN